MVALDTNVIVRYLVRDNLEQAEAARGLVEGLTSENPGFICRESMVEIAWVLKRVYRFSRARNFGNAGGTDGVGKHRG